MLFLQNNVHQSFAKSRAVIGWGPQTKCAWLLSSTELDKKVLWSEKFHISISVLTLLGNCTGLVLLFAASFQFQKVSIVVWKRKIKLILYIRVRGKKPNWFWDRALKPPYVPWYFYSHPVESYFPKYNSKLCATGIYSEIKEQFAQSWEVVFKSRQHAAKES